MQLRIPSTLEKVEVKVEVQSKELMTTGKSLFL